MRADFRQNSVYRLQFSKVRLKSLNLFKGYTIWKKILMETTICLRDFVG